MSGRSAMQPPPLKVCGHSIAGPATERAAREYVQVLNALDAPFEAAKREAALARMGQNAAAGVPCAPRGSAAHKAQPLGLVFNETKRTQPGERLEINTQAKRIKRMRTAVEHSARMIDFSCVGGGRRWNKKFLTLTYADVDGWEPGHIRDFSQRLRMWCKRRGLPLRAVWVSELQQRGAVHYHMVVWLPRGYMIPKPDRVGWWQYGMTNVKTVKNPTAYIAKYASKTGQDEAARYPKGARMHGACGLDKENRRHLRYWQAPFWVRDGLGGAADIRKVTGGYADKITGEFLPSPWVVVLEGGKVWAIKKPDDNMRIH